MEGGIYLEPGEAWALNAGFFLTTVLDVLQNGDTRLANFGTEALHVICRTFWKCPYRPPLLGAGSQERMPLQSVLEDQPVCPGML